MSSPLVSVVVPVFNGERFLAAALDSVSAQTYRPVEVIVVDDGSTDRSPEIARSRPVRYLRQSNCGVAAARNAGIAAARGTLVAFIDQDDEWEPHKLTTQVGHLLDRPDLGFVLARLQWFLEPGTAKPPWLREEWLTVSTPGYAPGVLLARRELFDRLGSYDESYEVGSDTEWMVRARDAGVGFEMLPDVLLRYRIHGDNAIYRTDALRAEIFRVLRASMARRDGKPVADPQGGMAGA